MFSRARMSADTARLERVWARPLLDGAITMASPWAIYGIVAVLGALIRVPMALYNFSAGYVEGDTSLINVDGIGYVRKAAGVQESFGDLNWLYEGMNSLMLRIGGSEHFLYLQMSVVNVILSLALPLAAWPAFAVLVSDSARRDRARILVAVALVLWPSSIWMSTQNMKDTLLALLVCAFTSAAVIVVQRGGRALLALATVAFTAWMILSLRVYAAAILVVALGIAVLFRWRTFPWLVVAGVLAVIGAALGPLRPTIETVLRPENRYFFDPEVVNAINEQRLGESEDFLQINSSLSAIGRDALRAPLNPFPSLRWRNGYDGLLMLRTIVVTVILGGFLVWLGSWRSPCRPFFVSALVLSWLFFSIGRSYSGPRQIFSTLEPAMIVLGAVALSESGRARFWMRSAVGGSIVLVVLLVYTSLADYTAASQALR